MRATAGLYWIDASRRRCGRNSDEPRGEIALVSQAAQTRLATAESRLRSGLDDFVFNDGRGCLTRVAPARRQTRSGKNRVDFVERTIGAQRAVVVAVLRRAPTETGARRDRRVVGGDSSHGERVLENRPRRERAIMAVSGVGFVRDRAQRVDCRT